MPSPVVELNLAVAVAMADGPAVGLARLEALEPTLDGYYLLHATRADLLRRLGRTPRRPPATAARSSSSAPNAERRFLARRLAETQP